jgi:ferredoxin
MFCPMLALMHLCRRLSVIRFEKDIHTYTGCGNCERMCPVNIADIHLEEQKADVMTQDCMGCMTCAESCPSDNTLVFSLTVGKWKYPLFSSSREYVAKKWSAK